MYQCSGSGVKDSVLLALLALLLPLLLQSFLSLAVLIPGQYSCHAHPRTREVKLVAQFDQGVIFPENLNHLHLYLQGSVCTRETVLHLTFIQVEECLPGWGDRMKLTCPPHMCLWLWNRSSVSVLFPGSA